MPFPDPDRSRAILVGTRSYRHGSGLDDLPGITGNINGLANVLIERTRLRPAHCRVLLDQTDDREVCRRIRQDAGAADDLLLVYFAGHGLIDPGSGELFLALSDSDPDDPLYSSLYFTELRELISRSRASTRVLILDCCYSGRAITTAMASSREDAAFAQTEIAGTYTLTATSANVLARAPAGEPRTLFTGALLDLFERGVPGAGPELTLGVVYAELRRTLEPQPRRQGTDTADQLALAPNRADGPIAEVRVTAAGGAPGSADEAATADDAGVVFLTSRHLRPANQFISIRFAAWIAAFIAGWLLWSAAVGGFGRAGWGSDATAGLLLMAACALTVERVPRRLPRHTYELRVDDQGMLLVVDTDVIRMSWHDIRHVSIVRSRPGRKAPDLIAVWPRRGFVPPDRLRAGPRMDGRAGVLRFCRPGWLDAEPDTIAETIARYAAGLWDGTHGIAAALPAAVFSKRTSIRLISLPVVAVELALGAIGLIGALQPAGGVAGLLATAAGAAWLGVFGGLALMTLTALLPARLSVDEHGVRVTGNLSKLDLSWPDIERAAIMEDPGIGTTRRQWLALRTRKAPARAIPAPLRGLPFLRKLTIPYDHATHLARVPLGALAVLPAEIDTALARFGTAAWAGHDPWPDPLSADESLTLRGRMPSPWARFVVYAVVFAAYWLHTELVSRTSSGAAVMLSITLGAVALLAPAFIAERSTLRLDATGLVLSAGKRATRVSWTEVTRVELVRVSTSALSAQAPTIIVWFKDGAPVPPRWRWHRCFVPHSGGVAVTRLRRRDGVAGDPADVRAALTLLAGPAGVATPPDASSTLRGR